MVIVIKNEKFRLGLWFPLSTLNSKMVRRVFCKSVLKSNSGNKEFSKLNNEANSAEKHCDLAQAEETQSKDLTAVSVVAEKKCGESDVETLPRTDEENSRVVNDDVLDKKALDSQLKAQFKQAYTILKQYIKKNGHFTLLEVKTADKETYVKIRV